MTLLGEAYVHLRPFKADEKRIQAIALEIERRCPTIADEIYGSSAEIGIRLEEGSLRTWIVVAGCLWTALGPAYNAIATYPKFKAGIKELYRDAKEFGDSVLNVVRRETAVSPSQLYRVERRTKTVGRIYRATKMIDRLKREAWKLNFIEYDDRVSRLRYHIHSLLADIEDQRDQELLRTAMLSAGLTPLPKPNEGLDGRVALVWKEDEFDWNVMPRLQAPAAGQEPDRPRLGWPTTIVLKDGRQVVLNAGRSRHLSW